MNTIFVRKLSFGEASVRIAVVENLGMYMVSERFNMPNFSKAVVYREMSEADAIEKAEAMLADWA
jgi:hypothetical protein